MAGMENQAKGGFAYLKGKLQWMVGKFTGNRSMQAKGAGNQVKGGVKYETGKVQGAIDKFTDK